MTITETYEPRWGQQSEPRQVQPSTIARISETLGALNTVGKYLVNMTRGSTETRPVGLPQEIPSAIYTISKVVLGRNVTDFIREALPSIAPTIPSTATTSVGNSVSSVISDANGANNNCLTPDGQVG